MTPTTSRASSGSTRSSSSSTPSCSRDLRSASLRRARDPALGAPDGGAAREGASCSKASSRELIQFGEENDAIGEKVHRLSAGAARRADLPALSHVALLPPARGLRRAARGAARLGQGVPPTSHEARRCSEAQRAQAAAMRRAALRPPRGNAVRCRGSARPRARALDRLVPLGPDRGASGCSRSAARTRSASSRRWARLPWRIGELCAAGVTARL